MRKRRKPGGLRKLRLDPVKAVPLLREAGAMFDDEPDTAFGYYDREGNLRRVLARWPRGWRVDLRLHVGGSWSLTQSLRMTVAGS